jgi:hypothetical protein
MQSADEPRDESRIHLPSSGSPPETKFSMFVSNDSTDRSLFDLAGFEIVEWTQRITANSKQE